MTSREDLERAITAAVVQGWCADANRYKAMDLDLVQVIVNNVSRLIAARDAEHAQERERLEVEFAAARDGLKLTIEASQRLTAQAAEREQAAVAAALREAAVLGCYCICHSGSSSRPYCIHCKPEAFTGKADSYCHLDEVAIHRILELIDPAQQSALDKLLAEAKRQGAEEMRERAAQVVDGTTNRSGPYQAIAAAREIRNLPLEEMRHEE